MAGVTGFSRNTVVVTDFDTVTDTGADTDTAYTDEPVNVAVNDQVPKGSFVVVNDAEPPANDTVANTVVPRLNVTLPATVPPAPPPPPATDDVKVTGAPTTAVVVSTDNDVADPTVPTAAATPANTGTLTPATNKATANTDAPRRQPHRTTMTITPRTIDDRHQPELHQSRRLHLPPCPRHHDNQRTTGQGQPATLI